MDRGLTIENPYASVTIPRVQLKDDFLRSYLGEDCTPGAGLGGPGALPPCSAAPEKAAGAMLPSLAWDRQESQAQIRPANPYASLKVPGAGAPEPFRWKTQEEALPSPGCCCGCRCSPCCRRCSCVVS